MYFADSIFYADWATTRFGGYLGPTTRPSAAKNFRRKKSKEAAKG
jgi:hypothetical protein